MRRIPSIAITVVFLLIIISETISAQENWAHYTEEIPVGTDSPKAVAVDWDGAVWVGGYRGLSKFDGETWTTFPEIGSNVNAICIGPDNTVWVGKNEVFKYDGETWTKLPEKLGVNSIACDNEGVLWVGGGIGVSRYDGESWLKFGVENGLAVPSVQTIAIAPNGDVWCAYSNIFYLDGHVLEGVSRYDGELWTTYTEDDGLASNNVFSITVTSDGTVWTVGDGGTSYFDGNSWNRLYMNGFHICTGPNDEVWSCGFTNLSCYKDGIIKKTDWGPFTITTMAVDSEGYPWIGSWSGLYQYDPFSVSVHETDSSPEELKILCSYPNPFNAVTTIQFLTPYNDYVNLSIYSLTGQIVKTLVSESLSSGIHSVRWDGRDKQGISVSSGIFFANLVTDSKSVTQKLLFLK